MKRAKAISLAVLMVQNSALTLAMRYSRTRKTAHRYHPSEAVVMSEVNNLQYVAASNLEPAVFQVLYQMKVLTTAFFSVVLLKRELKPAQWSAIALLAAGLATVGSATTGPSAPKPGVNFAVGFAAVFAACCSSGFSSVYFERVVKQRSRPLPKAPPRGRVARDAPPPARKPISVWARNAQMATFSSTIAFTGALLKDGDAIRARGALAGFSPIVWCTVVLQAGGGLCTAAVIAYADNLLKGFATGGSMVISRLGRSPYLAGARPSPLSRAKGPVRDATRARPAAHCTAKRQAKPSQSLTRDVGVGRSSESAQAPFESHIVADAADQSSAP
ncbi:pyrimidine nucleotide-sugar transmembrane transporter [Aureococcus anophagefferens]|nr:pyrimidine nucleotide-sugar transmembrane transporter [Aureococcus anophagefferens]